MTSVFRSLATLVAFTFILISFTMAPGVAAAQDAPSAVLVGQVNNAAGGALTEAVVTARDTAAGTSATATAVANGSYRLELAPGAYVVEARLVGYRPVTRVLRLNAGETRVDFTLARHTVELDPVVVTATRSATALSEIPATMSVVEHDEIAAQAAVSTGLAEVLGKAVPGLGAGLQSMSTYGQSIRGRNMSVLIDGVPLSTVRNVSRDLATIDPAVVERVEVLRGASAIYGDGATGGVINIITRAPTPGLRRPTLTSELQFTSSLTDVGSGNGVRFLQGVSGAAGKVDYTINGAFSRLGGFFDAQGDRVPSDPHGQGGLSDSRSWDVFGKLGYTLSADQRLQLTINHYDFTQPTDYVSLPSTEEGKLTARPGLDMEQPQNSRNGVYSLDYSHADLFGSELRAQVYYRDYLTRFGPYASTLTRQEAGDTEPVSRVYPRQSFLDSEKAGLRLEVDTRLGSTRLAPTLTWGLDYVDERTHQALTIFDRDAWTAGDSLVYRKVDEWMWVPPLRTRGLGMFVQAGWQPLPGWTVRGGVRHERANAKVDDFTTIEQVAVQGGTLRYRPVLFNLGTVVSPVESVDLFVNFSQGFSLADIGRVLRSANTGFILGTHQVGEQLVNQYELGARMARHGVQSSLSLFYSESELGSTYDTDLNIVRAPERIYGVEATLDLQPAPRWRTGAALSWTEGEAFVRKDTLSADSVWKALGGQRIQPLNLTAYAQHQTTARWSNRLQVFFSADRDRAYQDFLRYEGMAVTGSTVPMEQYVTVDLLSSFDIGRGTLTLGVENLLNEFYFNTASQLKGGEEVRAAARGRTMTLGYAVTY